MIEFLSVLGSVIVEDKKNGYNQAGASGLKLSDDGDYLIVTSPSSSVRLRIGKDTIITLDSSSLLVISKTRRFKGRYDGVWGSVELVVGRVWAKLMEQFGTREGIPDEPQGNAVIGIRG
jgi:hypothetical protein